jgi:hypothetical protein
MKNSKKFIAVILSMYFISMCFVSVCFAENTAEKEVVILDDAEYKYAEGNWKDVGDYYNEIEPLLYAKAERIKSIWSDIWAKADEELIYTNTNQIACRDQNFETLAKMNDKAAAEEEKMTVGDFNSDGKVSVADARIILRVAIGLQELPEGITTALVDIEYNGRVDVADARLVLRAAVKLEKQLTYLEVSFPLDK